MSLIKTYGFKLLFSRPGVSTCMGTCEAELIMRLHLCRDAP